MKLLSLAIVLLSATISAAARWDFKQEVYFYSNVYLLDNVSVPLQHRIPTGTVVTVQSGTITPDQNYAFPQNVSIAGSLSGKTALLSDSMTIATNLTIGGKLVTTNFYVDDTEVVVGENIPLNCYGTLYVEDGAEFFTTVTVPELTGGEVPLRINSDFVAYSNATLRGTTTMSNAVIYSAVFLTLPTATNGLPVGTLWNDGGTLKIKL